MAVTSPAGYGKSTMLAEWAEAESRPVAWATVDTYDDDPVALLTLLATAFAHVSPQADALSEEMVATETGVLGRSAPVLATAISNAPTPFVLLIDDIHAASSDACHDVLEVVLAGVPAGSQVVLASRHEQPYLARLRAEGALFEVTPRELRIGHDGARAIFRAAGVTVSDETLGWAVDRCEGWAAGLFLCALAVRSGADVSDITGRERFVADYLYGEVLVGLSDDAREFLRRSAVLEEMSGPLCNAVLERNDSHAQLLELESRSVFIVALDRDRRLFRYHALFREFLLAELARVDTHTIGLLHRRAAEWCVADGSPERALEHYHAAGELRLAGRLVAALAIPTWQSGRATLVDRWLSRLGGAAIEASPELMVIAAWTAALRGQSPAAEMRASMLERTKVEFETQDEAVIFESSRAMIRTAMCVRDPSGILDDARSAAANIPEWSPWRAPALYLLGTAWILNGSVDQARRAFTDSAERGRRGGNTIAIILSEAELAALALDGPSVQTAADHSHEAMRKIDEHHIDDYPTATLALAVSARVALRQGDGAGARQLLARAMRARIHCTHVVPFVAIRARIQIAKGFAAVGDAVSARQLMKEVDDLLLRRPNLVALADPAAELRNILGNDVGNILALPLTPAEMRLLPYLQTHLMIGEIGSRLFISRNTASTEVKSIYRKLGVTTRSSAVERAIELGLLGE
ncbi:helix-turn-helix transcriptional regulator [Microbacterium sp. Root166]|uniref:helix-turn-helix transcriptional regulator n=1 Tax=Microbacterium sp. Root166 TaxID=1736478 RepID=UPI0012F8B7CC|nr:LuxR family transcriptional regulator [Microbacterium sp. Root166]